LLFLLNLENKPLVWISDELYSQVGLERPNSLKHVLGLLDIHGWLHNIQTQTVKCKNGLAYKPWWIINIQNRLNYTKQPNSSHPAIKTIFNRVQVTAG